MIFTSQENQDKIVKLMGMVDDMHKKVDMSLSQADQVELAVAFMIEHLLISGDNVVMSYDMAHKLYRINKAPVYHVVVRLMPSNIVITRIWLARTQLKVFSVMHPDGTCINYDDFRFLLEKENILCTNYIYIEYVFSQGWYWLNTYKRAQTWSKNIISNCERDYYGDHDYIFCKLKPAVTEFIDSAPIDVSLDDIMAVINSVN